jgi:hypothetical protein
MLSYTAISSTDCTIAGSSFVTDLTDAIASVQVACVRYAEQDSRNSAYLLVGCVVLTRADGPVRLECYCLSSSRQYCALCQSNSVMEAAVWRHTTPSSWQLVDL